MKIDYVEFPATDLEATKAFYGAAFGWTFQDWGPEYMGISDAGLKGGFRNTGEPASRGGTVVILHTEDLDAAEKAVRDAGGKILDRLDFPGGRRFHFADPSGNELAVWTEA